MRVAPTHIIESPTLSGSSDFQGTERDGTLYLPFIIPFSEARLHIWGKLESDCAHTGKDIDS